MRTIIKHISPEFNKNFRIQTKELVFILFLSAFLFGPVFGFVRAAEAGDAAKWPAEPSGNIQSSGKLVADLSNAKEG